MSPSSRVYLVVIICGLLPAAVVAVSMFIFKNIFIAMFLMHWLVMVPIIVGISVSFHGREGLLWYWKYLKQQEICSIIWYNLALIAVGVAVVIGGYALGSCKSKEWDLCIGQVDDNIAEYGFKHAPNWLLALCGIYFPFVNPIVEEFFWRVFFHREIELAHEAPSSNDIEERSTLVEESQEGSADPSLVIPKAPSNALTVDKRVVFAMLYASYHTIVVGVFLGGVRYGALSFFLVAILGYLLQEILIRGNPNHGFLMSLSLHIGVDLGVVIALGDSLGWYNLV